MPKNKQSDLIAGVKLLNIGPSKKYKLRNRGGGNSALVNYQLLQSNILPSVPSPYHFSLYNIDEIDYIV